MFVPTIAPVQLFSFKLKINQLKVFSLNSKLILKVNIKSIINICFGCLKMLLLLAKIEVIHLFPLRVFINQLIRITSYTKKHTYIVKVSKHPLFVSGK